MATSYLYSKKTYRMIGAVLVIAVIIPAVYWFNYYRIADFEMRWMTGEQANFHSREPNFDRDGNPKILILWPDKTLHCYQSSYSKDLLAYLQKEHKSTVRVTLQLRYSYGSIYAATILRFGNYHLRDELSELRQDANGNCMKHLEEYAEPPGLGERHQCCDPIRIY
jgi:hypothetical protein